MKTLNRLLLISILIAPVFSWSQTKWKEVTSAKLVLETTGVLKDQPFQIGFLIDLKPGWHTYWKNSGESGTGPTFDWGDAQEKISSPHFPPPIRFDEGGITTFGFKEQVLLIFDHKGISESQNLNVNAEWLVCKEVCIPAIASFNIDIAVQAPLDIKPSLSAILFDGTRRDWPTLVESKISIKGGQAYFQMADPKGWTDFDFFPYQTLPFENLTVTTEEAEPGQHRWSMKLKPKTKVSEVSGVAVFRSTGTEKSFEILAPATLPISEDIKGGLLLLGLAFIGGLILNLMPCVFPILSLKLFSILKSSNQNFSRIRRENLSYVAGVLISFLILGHGLSLIRNLGVQVGWGFQLQSPMFVGSLVVLFVILALEMLGFFEMSLIDPNKGHKLTRVEGLWGSFFTGVLAVVVASPCAAPFMGAAVGAALGSGGLYGALIFFFLGLGLAFPYILLAISPKFLSWMPKPGAWMKTIKEFMAFPMLLTAIWLVWIFLEISDSSSLLFLLVCLVGLVFSIWLSRFHKALAWILGLSIVFGFLYVMYSFNASPTQMVKEGQSGWSVYNEALLKERKPGQIQFVNMTADWCITCKVNERLVFSDSVVQTFFEDNKIVKIKGDWTKREPNITAFLDRFGRAGVPFYVIFSDKYPDGQALSELLSVDSFIESFKEHTTTNEKE